jgi:hypothetical protein
MLEERRNYGVPMRPPDLNDLRWEAWDRLQKMTRKRRRLLGTFIDEHIDEVHPSSQLFHTLTDLRQFCELPGELDGVETTKS